MSLPGAFIRTCSDGPQRRISSYIGCQMTRLQPGQIVKCTINRNQYTFLAEFVEYVYCTEQHYNSCEHTHTFSTSRLDSLQGSWNPFDRTCRNEVAVSVEWGFYFLRVDQCIRSKVIYKASDIEVEVLPNEEVIMLRLEGKL